MKIDWLIDWLIGWLNWKSLLSSSEVTQNRDWSDSVKRLFHETWSNWLQKTFGVWYEMLQERVESVLEKKVGNKTVREKL